MGAVSAEIRLSSIDRFIRKKHGSYRRMTNRELNTLTKYIQEIVHVIESDWPILTGYSIVRWTWRNESSVGSTKFILENKAWYADWVHSKGTRRVHWRWSGEAIWKKLVPRAFNQIKGAMLRDLKKEIERTERTREDLTGPQVQEATFEELVSQFG